MKSTLKKVEAKASKLLAPLKHNGGNSGGRRGSLGEDGKLQPGAGDKLRPQVARLNTLHFASPDKVVGHGKTYGIIKVVVHEADLSEAAQYYAVVSIGAQTFASGSSKQTANPVWNEGHNLVLQRGEATIAHIALYRVVKALGRSNKLVGHCEVDLAMFFEEGATPAMDTWQVLEDVADPTQSVGRIRIETKASSLASLEEQFWRRILTIADFNNDGKLNWEEFVTLMRAFGCELDDEELKQLYDRADMDKDGAVQESELAHIMSEYQSSGDLYTIIKRCPVSGAELLPGENYANMIYITLCMDQGTGQSLRGGYHTPEERARSWMFKMSEWATQPLAGHFKGVVTGNKYGVGLNVGANAAHIIVYNRAQKRLIEEKISPHLVLAMRNMYQSQVGRVMMKAGAFHELKAMSREQGRKMDSPDSVKDIKTFLKSFQGELNVSESLEPIDSFKCFNEFFYRKLKPEARPIAMLDNADVVVSAADCRFSAFESVSDATRLWIKGKLFSIPGLLADTDPSRALSAEFEGGSMAIFRLAPQDYHRFHFPVGGTVESITDVPGQLYTVNPIAVNSTFCNVFTENKRAVVLIDSPDYGRVAFVAIGATMVGSIHFTAEAGKSYKKGDEMGYFAFGGSTTIALFQEKAVVFDEDLISNSMRSLETLVKMGERIGVHPTSSHLHSSSTKFNTLQQLEEQTGHIMSIDQAQKAMASSEGQAEGAQPAAAGAVHTAVPLTHPQNTPDAEEAASVTQEEPSAIRNIN